MKPLPPLACIAFAVLFAGVAAPVETPDDKRRELRDLQDRIGVLQETLERTRGQKGDALLELEELERRVGATARGLRDLERDLEDRTEALAHLQSERARREERLGGQRDALAAQLRAAFVMGRQERLKLLLSQEQPGLLSRLMAYHEYLSLSRARRIGEIRARVSELLAVETEVAEERDQLERLRARREAERAELEALRTERRGLVAELDRALQEKGATLASLQRDAASLEALIERLERRATEREARSGEPMSRRKGRLAWPVDGRLSVRYGASRASGGLVWDGVVIDAALGTEVKAVHHGRVAFADWLRGFGLLLILDHGAGYMSLYGFNQTLLRETGEWVEAGDAIALVGDSGGRHRASLYFGIRHEGRPQDPGGWCAARPDGGTG
jgi:septal ring factor EnvC (AmiA/AmiB activator)